MLDKFGTLGSIISSSFGYLSLYIRNEEKNDLLRNYLHFLQLALKHLAYLAQLRYVYFDGHYYWSHFCHNFEF